MRGSPGCGSDALCRYAPCPRRARGRAVPAPCCAAPCPRLPAPCWGRAVPAPCPRQRCVHVTRSRHRSLVDDRPDDPHCSCSAGSLRGCRRFASHRRARLATVRRRFPIASHRRARLATVRRRFPIASHRRARLPVPPTRGRRAGRGAPRERRRPSATLARDGRTSDTGRTRLVHHHRRTRWWRQDDPGGASARAPGARRSRGPPHAGAGRDVARRTLARGPAGPDRRDRRGRWRGCCVAQPETR